MGSGGGSSGQSSWPEYMMDAHGDLIRSFNSLIPTANPYTGIVAYNPTTVLNTLAASLTTFKAYYTSIGTTLTAFKSAWSGWLTTVSTNLNAAMVAALDISGIPEFEAGMRDINAVQTSSFALGKSMLYARVGLEASKLALTNANQAIDLTMKYGELLRGQFVSEADYSRVVIIAYKEQIDRQLELDIEEAKWVFFNYREAGALLGAIGGPSGLGHSGKPNSMVSALGGAMAGAVGGAYIGSVVPGIGTAVGAVAGAIIGGVGGYLSAS